jgi:hypothetical protein
LDTAGTTENEAHPENAHPDPEEGQDQLLTGFVRAANNAADKGTEMEVSVTLAIGGLIVSGLMVSDKAYYRGIAEGLRNVTGGGSPEIAKAVGEALAEQLEELAKPSASWQNEQSEASAEDAAGDQAWPTVYIHLKDAQLYQPGYVSPAPVIATWWRGRLSAVDGFTLGYHDAASRPS